MGDPSEPPSGQSSNRRSFQASDQDRRRSREASQSQAWVSEEVPQMLLSQQRGSEGVPTSLPETNLRWSQRAGLPENEDLQLSQTFQGAEAPMGHVEHPGFPSGFQTQAYLDDSRTLAGEQTTNLMLQQLQQGQGGLQQLEPTYHSLGASFLSQFDSYHREEYFKPGTQHSTYARDAAPPQFSLSEQGFLYYSPEAPEPPTRELAVQNAKAYLLQTGVGSDLSL